MAYSSSLPVAATSSLATAASPSAPLPGTLPQIRSRGLSCVYEIASILTGSSRRRRGGEYEPLLGRRVFVDVENLGSKPLKTHRRQWVLCGTVYGLVLLTVLIVLNASLFVWQLAYAMRSDPDAIFSSWGLPGTGTEHLAWYPTDFLRDVIPVPCHSHNDYWRNVPLFSALYAGCVGVEADVWLLDGYEDELYVGHSRAALQPNRTFRSLYVDPLVEILARQNKDHHYFSGNDSSSSVQPRGVFDIRPDQTLVLLVDIKTSGPETFHKVLEGLEPLRSRGWLTTYRDGRLHQGPITVVGSGRTPFADVVANSTYRDVFFDAPLDRIENSQQYDQTNSYYSSVAIGEGLGTIWFGIFRESQLQLLRHQVRQAHDHGLKARYWDLPAWPISARNRVWDTLVSEGVDMLNVDDLNGATKSNWDDAGWFGRLL
ncbi:hypothetical protein CMQ_239 [Grosmannia clavigera kw1407]|uniref:Altered inheritance of mitochondria protein 6 n=1 Tax=Grosmannia clavigera (strain kw1407 / UAMH 11150) TaxID=655863 RepID=F0XRG5_GROCL|nr:uncharacterized protein CMQ_239 [Grosmannia clavigera kw1407]EFW99921.1 hypothetical protein CMQ_239 [Grosmannia clavigera kw1407]